MDVKRPEYDVVILGGSLAGAATACLILRERPELRVLILEKSVHFPRRVGEATVEVSGYFLSRVLGLTQFLNETQLTKQGMRFWFSGPESATLADCGEIGGRYLSRAVEGPGMAGGPKHAGRGGAAARCGGGRGDPAPSQGHRGGAGVRWVAADHP